MEQPQNYMGKDYIKSTYEPKRVEHKVIKPFYPMSEADKLNLTEN